MLTAVQGFELLHLARKNGDLLPQGLGFTRPKLLRILTTCGTCARVRSRLSTRGGFLAGNALLGWIGRGPATRIGLAALGR